MRILILHKVPFSYIKYDEIIDHNKYDVVYFGKNDRLNDIPKNIPCKKIILPENQTFLEEVKNSCEKFMEIDSVVSASQYELKNASLIRDIFNAFEDVDNKVKMKNKILKSNLTVPRFFPFQDIEILTNQDLPDKVVLKPLADTSSNNVYIYDSITELKEKVTDEFLMTRMLNKNDLEIEEFIEGNIYHFDGIVSNGEILIIQASQCYGSCFEYAQGSHFASLQVNDAQKEQIASKYVIASGIKNGVFHLEMIDSPKHGLIFLEIAPRPGGGGIVDMFNLRYGINLTSADIALQAGIFNTQEFLPMKSDKLFGQYQNPGHKFPHKKSKVVFNNFSKKNIIKTIIAQEDYIFDGKITYNAGEVPLYLLLEIDKSTSAQDIKYFISQINKNIKIEFI
jgi:hypothetical protein